MNLNLLNLPKKCYICKECQKFTPTLDNNEICLICGHYEAQHEQFIDLQLKNFAKEHSEDSLKSNLFNNRLFELENANSTLAITKSSDVTNFLNKINVRDRLIMANNNNKTRVSSYNFHGNIRNSSFKCTITIIMMPYISNNKIISVHSFQWTDLQFYGFIKEVIFKDDRPEAIERTIVETFSKANNCGWQILRPSNAHLYELIPFENNSPRVVKKMKILVGVQLTKRCYIGPVWQNVFDRKLATTHSELLNLTNRSTIHQSTTTISRFDSAAIPRSAVPRSAVLRLNSVSAFTTTNSQSTSTTSTSTTTPISRFDSAAIPRSAVPRSAVP
ncbi:hypothetical protein RclHR1_13730013 [Rhizophagus clarus]|uniref:Uncharacterized protein n=1 Tax=Rhizophagus clarus TaxID=94130 RepID=A0A2Z6QAX2_9GLOM|nr:hypothetical protein RclHR1_13730013 [Rhizophagus clarus]